MRTRSPEETARALRRDFDASFAVAPPLERPRALDFLMMGVAGDPYAIALADVSGLHRDWRIVPIATDAPELIGVAGSRGAIVAVYDLGALLGYPPERAARWVVTLRASTIALAFARFDGHVQVSPEAIAARDAAPAHTRGTLAIAVAPRPILDVAAVVEVIARRAPTRGSAREP